MLVGSKHIDINELERACSHSEKLNKYVLSLVPEAFRHIEELVNNQKYLVAMQIRSSKKMSFNRRTFLCEELLKDVVVRGSINVIFDVEDLMLNVNVTRILKVLFEEELEE